MEQKRRNSLEESNLELHAEKIENRKDGHDLEGDLLTEDHALGGISTASSQHSQTRDLVLDSLPPEVLLTILGHCPPVDMLLVCGSVSRRWRHLVTNSRLWHTLTPPNFMGKNMVQSFLKTPCVRDNVRHLILTRHHKEIPEVRLPRLTHLTVHSLEDKEAIQKLHKMEPKRLIVEEAIFSRYQPHFYKKFIQIMFQCPGMEIYVNHIHAEDFGISETSHMLKFVRDHCHVKKISASLSQDVENMACWESIDALCFNSREAARSRVLPDGLRVLKLDFDCPTLDSRDMFEHFPKMCPNLEEYTLRGVVDCCHFHDEDIVHLPQLQKLELDLRFRAGSTPFAPHLLSVWTGLKALKISGATPNSDLLEAIADANPGLESLTLERVSGDEEDDYDFCTPRGRFHLPLLRHLRLDIEMNVKAVLRALRCPELHSVEATDIPREERALHDDLCSSFGASSVFHLERLESHFDGYYTEHVNHFFRPQILQRTSEQYRVDVYRRKTMKSS